MKVGIIGLGEVGSAIKKLAQKKHTIFGRSLDKDNLKGRQIEVLHLCYPYSDKFTTLAVSAIKELKPRLVIIHSTVKPGTTAEIYQLTQVNMAHSPIMGKHPHLYAYLFRTEKVIGAVNNRSYLLTKKHLNQLGLKTIRFKSSLESEMAKVFCTTYYGLNIVFLKYLYAICRKQGADFHEVYTVFNHLYNRAYAKTMPYVRRPVLKYVPGEIGGHCVIPNAQIIESWLHDDLTRFILSENEKAKKEK